MDARKAELSGNEYQREIRTRGSSGRGAGEDRRMGGGDMLMSEFIRVLSLGLP